MTFRKISIVALAALALLVGVNGAGPAHATTPVQAITKELIDRNGMMYATVAISQTDQVLGTNGQAGDYLDKIIITVATAATGTVSIKDGGGSAISIMPASPGGGIGVYVVDIGIKSTAGAWKITTGAGATVVAVGRWTN